MAITKSTLRTKEAQTKKDDNGHYLSIDLGITNMMTCYDNLNGKSFIISGGEWLSINRYFDKKIGYYQSISNAQQSAKGIKYPKKSKRVLSLYKKRAKQVSHLLHSATKEIIDYCLSNDISRVITGDITHIREGANHGKVNNQKLHKFPFARIYLLLDYKLVFKGIEFNNKQNEAYSSQCSPLSPSVSKEYAEKQNRKKRGLYKDGKIIFNADSVGAFNAYETVLWNLLINEIVEHADADESDITDEIAFNYINQINDIDVRADTFIYPINNRLCVYFAESKEFDVENVYEFFMEILNLLDAVDSMMAVYNEWKADMEYEMKQCYSDYYNDYDY